MPKKPRSQEALHHDWLHVSSLAALLPLLIFSLVHPVISQFSYTDGTVCSLIVLSLPTSLYHSLEDGQRKLLYPVPDHVGTKGFANGPENENRGTCTSSTRRFVPSGASIALCHLHADLEHFRESGPFAWNNLGGRVYRLESSLFS